MNSIHPWLVIISKVNSVPAMCSVSIGLGVVAYVK